MRNLYNHILFKKASINAKYFLKEHMYELENILNILGNKLIQDIDEIRVFEPRTSCILNIFTISRCRYRYPYYFNCKKCDIRHQINVDIDNAKEYTV